MYVYWYLYVFMYLHVYVRIVYIFPVCMYYMYCMYMTNYMYIFLKDTDLASKYMRIHAIHSITYIYVNTYMICTTYIFT
jgi:hypothetical protein